MQWSSRIRVIYHCRQRCEFVKRKMTENCKRSLDENGVAEDDSGLNKKPRTLEDGLKNDEMSDVKSSLEPCESPSAVKEERIRRRKVVLLLTYSGWGYLGMQRNPDAKTIEGDLLQALLKSGAINQEVYEKPQRILFQRAARTDKGVSAVKQVVSLKLPEDAKIADINDHLPAQIRVVCMKRTTKGFNSKVNCDARTYSYVLPTYAFSPIGIEPDDSFRITEDIISKVKNVLKIYEGTHNFHNFTLKKDYKDASAKRYMLMFTCSAPFVRDEVEYMVLTVKGQSFMQHHIRKMVGLAIAVVRGYTSEETIRRAFDSEPLDIPKAPGLGLMLEEVHYERYNSRYGSDGIHEKLDWSEFEEFIQDFKEKHILANIIKIESEEKSMLTWLTTLPGHSYSLRENRPPTAKPLSSNGQEDIVNLTTDVKSESENVTIKPDDGDSIKE